VALLQLLFGAGIHARCDMELTPQFARNIEELLELRLPQGH